MAYRKHLLITAFLLNFCFAHAQTLTYEQADSTSNALFKTADWEQLIRLGERSIESGIDFPVLRSRLGYARLMSGNYSAALREYNRVFKSDFYNQEARYYAYLCHLYLNQSPGASFDAGLLDQSQLNTGKIHTFDFLNAGFETGIKYTDNYYRGNAFYNRVSLSNRLTWKLQMDQSFSFFNQPLQNGGPPNDADNTSDRQTEYYGKLSYSLSERIILLGIYHYLNTNYQNISYNSHIGSLGLRYTGTYFDLQGDVDFGYMIDHHLTQYNAELFFYPRGNLNLYTISRISLLDQKSSDKVIFGQSAGFKALKNTWLETSVTFGKLDNYIGTDGLYIYNSFDVSSFMLGETAFYQLGKHAQLRLNYTFENKRDEPNNLNYHQHSFTTGILWKF